MTHSFARHLSLLGILFLISTLFSGCALVSVRQIEGSPAQVLEASSYAMDTASIQSAMDHSTLEQSNREELAPFHSIVVSTLHDELAERGLTRTERENAQLLVSYHFSIATRSTEGVSAFHMRHSNDMNLSDITRNPAADSARDPYEYDKGYLVIEFRNSDGELLWSGEAKGQVNEYNRDKVRIKRAKVATREIIALLD